MFSRKLILSRRNLAVAWYLIASYTYYWKDTSLISDADFDWLSKRLLQTYDELDHPHKHLISKEELEAGTLMLKEDDYPSIAKDSAESLIREQNK